MGKSIIVLLCVALSGCQNFWLNLAIQKVEEKAAFERNVQLTSFSNFYVS